MMARASAPGKIILFGEHAVVYGYPALAVPVSRVRAIANVTRIARGRSRVIAPGIHLDEFLDNLPADHPIRAIISSTMRQMGVDVLPACKIYIHSTIPVASGMGSGAAIAAALIRALALFVGRSLDDGTVNSLTFESEKSFHGNPSGIDNTVVTYEQPVFFVRGQPFQTVTVGKPLRIIIANSGIPSQTKVVVSDVRRLWEANQSHYNAIFEQMGRISHQGRQAIESGEIQLMGRLMDENHALLQELGVSSRQLDALVMAARPGGALGAKLSGAGRGGNMIALVDEKSRPAVIRALKAAGAVQIIATRVG
jgi:mevalonate kinase